MVILSMVGGILADRINKKNIMVVLDFCTAVIIFVFYLTLGKVPTIPLFIIVLMLLYGISGTYQPSVQASIPLLVSQDNLMLGNAFVNQVNTLSNLLGPIIGGIMFGIYGIYPILILSIVCFIFSGIMEIFIYIPYKKSVCKDSILKIMINDLKESYFFIKNKKPIFFSLIILVSIFNLVLSSVIIVGIPIIITNILGMSDLMYGFAQALLALGGLFGGILTAILVNKLKLKNAYILLLICALCVAIIGLSLLIKIPVKISYLIIIFVSFIIMTASTVFIVQIYTVLQEQTPPELVGKIMAALISIAMCGQPIGQAIYGFLFDIFKSHVWIVLIFASIISLVITLYSKKYLVD